MAPPLSRLKLSKARILVVDDSAQAMELLSQILLGFGVTQARKCADTGEATKLAEAESFDLVLVDQEMPAETGADFCRRLRGDPKGRNYTTPVIVLSGLPSRETVAMARDAGAHFVLAKPIVPGVLLDRIDWIARNHREFITSDSYRGPDRRFQNQALPEGTEERRSETLKMLEAPERALSQDEINALFG